MLSHIIQEDPLWKLYSSTKNGSLILDCMFTTDCREKVMRYGYNIRSDIEGGRVRGR